jgi:hypothetical protein
MTKYDLLQTLEMIFPNSSDKDHNDAWFITEDEYAQDEGVFIQITFKLDEGVQDNA